MMSAINIAAITTKGGDARKVSSGGGAQSEQKMLKNGQPRNGQSETGRLFWSFLLAEWDASVACNTREICHQLRNAEAMKRSVATWHRFEDSGPAGRHFEMIV